jgi:predicted metal-dependent phosphotriesterase family hydrolase
MQRPAGKSPDRMRSCIRRGDANRRRLRRPSLRRGRSVRLDQRAHLAPRPAVGHDRVPVQASGVVIGHADSYLNLDFYLEVLDGGANLQFDFLGHRFGVEEALEPRLVETIVELLERGYGPQLLLSQDVCHNRQLKAYGGFGYVYLQQHFLPTLRTAAVGEGEIRTMTVDNPARILTIP